MVECAMRDVPPQVLRFRSFEESDAHDAEYYRNLTPDERVDILLTLVAQYTESLDEAAQGFAYVCRVARLGEG